jgi:uncharacterized protein YndB with AHSA1/START domain
MTKEEWMNGELEQLDDGRWQLRFTRTLPHPPEKVWRAITEPEHLAGWFPTTIEGERATGASLRFSFPNEQAPPFDGEMLAYVPCPLLSLRWGPDVLRIELSSIEGGTALTLLDILEARGKAARDGAGWHTCLDALEAALRGEPDARAAMGGWSAVHGLYVESFGPEAATIGPAAGFD